MDLASLASGITILHYHATQGELWYLLIGILVGILIGVHMARPRWFRGRDVL